MTASVVRQQGVYTVSFDDQPIVMRFASFKESSEQLNAMVTVYSELALYPGLLHEKRFNLLSSQTQAGWAKHLDKVTEHAKLPWNLLLEEACLVVRRAWANGDPAVRLKDVKPPPGGSWIIPGLLLARMPTIWFGAGGDGKSLLAMAAACAMQYGRPELFGGLQIAQVHRPLWLDWEFDSWENAQRARAILGDEPDIAYARCFGHIRNQVERIGNMLVQEKCDYLIIDSAAFAAGGKPENSDEVNDLFDTLRRFEVGSLILAHETKGSDHEMPFGSVYWWNGARSIWNLAKSQESGGVGTGATLQVGMFQKKTNKGVKWHDFGFSVEIENNDADDMLSCRVQRTDVRTIAGLEDRVTVGQRILLELEKGPLNNQQLSLELTEKIDTIRKTTTRLRRAGLILPLAGAGETRFALVSRQPTPIRDKLRPVPGQSRLVSQESDTDQRELGF